MNLKIEPTKLQDCVVITPARFGDERGFFEESYSQKNFVEAGIDVEFVQDNHSQSAAVGTLRGLHFQAPPFAQDKLVRVARGKVLDVAVDVRQGSPSYKQWVGVELSAENGKQLFVPKGFLHGFVTLEPDTIFLYKVSNYYDAKSDGSIRYDDPDLGVEWGVNSALTLSAKDEAAMAFSDWENPFQYEGNA